MSARSLAPGRAKQLRAETRMKVLLTAEVVGAAGTVTCRVCDLSRGGACLEADQSIPVGAQLILRRDALSVSAVVAWSTGCRFGLRFDAPIRATELLVQMSQSRAAQEAAPVSLAAIPLFPSS
jgi:hypothetical protein